MSIAPSVPRPRALPFRALSLALNFVLGTLATLSPITAIFLLGWLMRIMQHRIGTILEDRPERKVPRWLSTPSASSWISCLFGDFARNIRAGLFAALSLGLATAPFALLWLAAWGAGWENSFNKGYEQAAIGPITGLLGVAVFSAIMCYLPMALAHQAYHDRPLAVFELRSVRLATRHAGWGLVAFAVTSLILAIPVFASRGLPVFAEGIAPEVADMTPAAVSELRDTIRLATGAYVFLTCLFLKRWSASLYARAVLRAGGTFSARSLTAASRTRGPARYSALGHLVRLPLLLGIWGCFAVMIFLGQFLNHSWTGWIYHPLTSLPWAT